VCRVRTEEPPSLGLLLLRNRKYAGLTQEALAERSGVSVNTISNLEGGRGNVPRQGTLDLLIAALIAARRHAPSQAADLRIAFKIAADAARARHVSVETAHRPEPPEDRQAMAHARTEDGLESWSSGDHVRAMALFEDSLVLYRALEDDRGIASALMNVGNVAKSQGEYRRAVTCYEEGLSLLRAHDDSSGIAAILDNLGSVVFVLGDFARAAVLHLECLILRRQLGDATGIARALVNLGMAIFVLGDVARARSLLEEGRDLFHDLGDVQGLAGAHECLDKVARGQDGHGSAESLHGESVAMAGQPDAGSSRKEQR
jgi:transcriptional regulator with XRE-family HTH domain